MESGKKLANAVKQRFTEFLVNVLIEHPIDDCLLHQQRPIHGEDLLLGLLITHLGSLEQFLKVHGSSPRISLFIFSIAR